MTTTKEILLAKFDEAIQLDTEAPDSDDALDAQNAAFDAALAFGWDWEEADRGEFAAWCLKATPSEILHEAKTRIAKL